METQFSCEECGGTEYYVETGFYYCKECHMQALQFREAVFESQEAALGATGARLTRKRKDREEKKQEHISSYETYNYIILGLVNELIAAGAKKELKGTVKWLWFKYLEKLEVIRDGLPKLSVLYSNIDAEIFYNQKRKKRRRRPSDSTSSDETMSSRRSHSRKKKEFIRANYALEASQDSLSVTNQSLTSLRSSSDIVTENAPKLEFNKDAKKFLLKKQSKRHFNLHCKDIHVDLKCHQLTSRSLGTKFKNSPNMITRNKLYSLIYLGLLIIKDDIQLSDMLRLIKEGHVSYNSVIHFFPEELQQNNAHLTNYLSRKMPLTHYSIRQVSAEMAKYLGITQNIPVQNLVNLCKRYCYELNLPDEILKCTLKLVAKAVPVMRVTKHCAVLPNYEARAISFIIFTLKLLFGLDDVTEYEFSNYAGIINNINKDSNLRLKEMFVFTDWMKHIQYRKCVLQKCNFPICFANDQSLNNVDLFTDFLNKNVFKCNEDIEVELSTDYQVYKKMLSDLISHDKNDDYPKVKFPTSLTPIRDYTDIILKSHLKSECLSLLKDEYCESSLDFLLQPCIYLQLINKSEVVAVKHRGANKQFKFMKVQNYKIDQYKTQTLRRKWITVKIANTDEIVEEAEVGDFKWIAKNKLEADRVLNAHKIANEDRQILNVKKIKKLSNTNQFSKKTIVHRDEDIYTTHYNSYETYWLSSIHLDRCGGEEGFEKVLSGLPHSFLLILEECADLLKLYKKHLLEEFIYLELYMCYITRFRIKSRKEVILDKEILKLINKAKRAW